MAAVPVAPLRRFALPTLSLARPAWSLPCIPSSSKQPPSSSLSPQPSTQGTLSSASVAYAAAIEASTPWFLPALPSLERLAELFPPLLWAVPKHKVTHSRKSMRSANKGLKNKTNFSHCEGCGQIKLAHNVCPNCYSQISRRWKKEARGDITVTRSVASTSSGSAEI